MKILDVSIDINNFREGQIHTQLHNITIHLAHLLLIHVFAHL